MAKTDNPTIVNSALSILSILLIVLGVFFILTGIKDVFFQKSTDQVANINTDNSGNVGEGLSTIRVPKVTEIVTVAAKTKSEKTQAVILQKKRWVATDYAHGDIGKGEYTVKQGDTLWEIAEAVYGSGFEWKKILNNNKANIGFLPNGSQALIIPGQKLNII